MPSFLSDNSWNLAQGVPRAHSIQTWMWRRGGADYKSSFPEIQISVHGRALHWGSSYLGAQSRSPLPSYFVHPVWHFGNLYLLSFNSLLIFKKQTQTCLELLSLDFLFYKLNKYQGDGGEWHLLEFNPQATWWERTDSSKLSCDLHRVPWCSCTRKIQVKVERWLRR